MSHVHDWIVILAAFLFLLLWVDLLDWLRYLYGAKVSGSRSMSDAAAGWNDSRSRSTPAETSRVLASRPVRRDPDLVVRVRILPFRRVS